MRGFKFRAWDFKHGRMLDHEQLAEPFMSEEVSLLQAILDGIPTNLYTDYPGADSYDLMLYTSRLDRNGVNLCESDIVRLPDSRLGVIMLGEYGRHDFGFFVNILGDEDVPLLLYELEVCGNIYENKELIK